MMPTASTQIAGWKGQNESNEQFDARSQHMKDPVDFVFGGGGPICMGPYLVMLEIKKLIATLYSQFDVMTA